MTKFLDLDPPQKLTCKGRFYRAEFNQYLNSNGHFVTTERVRPMKRMSCKGCPSCEGLMEYLREDIGNDCPPEFVGGFKGGHLYELKIINYSRDWESGHVDDLTLGFVEKI